MGHTNQRLAQLIGSRICHDLISPIGAIGNGLELIQMQAELADTPELALIAQSLHHASARIRFYRIAFGLASDIQQVGAGEITSILTDIARDGRVAHVWQAGDSCTRSELQLVFLGLMCLETALPLGGSVTVTVQDGRWHLRGTGQRIRWDDRLWHGADEDGEIGADRVQFALLHDALPRLGRTLTTEAGETSVRISF
ncbi:histidine phosphotransferase family protein [Thalassovita aquimarina]|uniref:histidine phosphotransferase family protein n=1 Tax=Thalassovita aquimarina TaxID=2785917 RepID=UPI003561F1AD